MIKKGRNKGRGFMSIKKEATSCSSETALLKELRTKAKQRDEALKKAKWVEMVKELPISTRDVSSIDIPQTFDFECIAQKIIEKGF